tara:strand:- start:2485 stop:3030 length:546 start_codon:yes stop_codon:yes gene_type:complete
MCFLLSRLFIFAIFGFSLLAFEAEAKGVGDILNRLGVYPSELSAIDAEKFIDDDFAFHMQHIAYRISKHKVRNQLNSSLLRDYVLAHVLHVAVSQVESTHAVTKLSSAQLLGAYSSLVRRTPSYAWRKNPYSSVEPAFIKHQISEILKYYMDLLFYAGKTIYADRLPEIKKDELVATNTIW